MRVAGELKASVFLVLGSLPLRRLLLELWKDDVRSVFVLHVIFFFFSSSLSLHPYVYLSLSLSLS